MDATAVKSERLLQIYSKLVSGEILKKKELAQHFHVTERSIQRDIVICTPFTGHPVEGVLLCGTHMSTKGNV